MTPPRGFSLVELMIVVTIVGILAAVAIPAYQDQTIRAQVAEGLSIAASAKSAVSEAYLSSGAWPSDNAAADLAPANGFTSRYVQSVAISAGGVITVTLGGQSNPALHGRTLALVPARGPNGDVSWLCGAGTLSGLSGFSVAAEAAPPANGGTVALKHRPANCR
jgi:type IV pilus assembly protein PilA